MQFPLPSTVAGPNGPIGARAKSAMFGARKHAHVHVVIPYRVIMACRVLRRMEGARVNRVGCRVTRVSVMISWSDWDGMGESARKHAHEHKVAPCYDTMACHVLRRMEVPCEPISFSCCGVILLA